MSQPSRVVVVGAVNVDFVVRAPRLPGPGETVVGSGVQRFGGGKGANAAVAAARAGAAVLLVGAVGSDDTGSAALAELLADGVDTTGVAVLDGAATGVALIVVDGAGENQIAVGAGANAAVEPAEVAASLAAALPGAGCVLVSTEIAEDAVATAVRAATSAGVVCVLNPAPVKPVVAELLDAGPVLTPNRTECLQLVAQLHGRAGHEPAGAVDPTAVDVLHAARRLQALTRAPVVVTLGGDGALVVLPGGEVEHLPPPQANVCDTTGAGDTFNGVLAARLAACDALRVAARTAVVAASLSVAHAGARAGMPVAAVITAAASARP